MEAFFRLHDDLPREGPGSDAEVQWAADLAGVSPAARLLDAGSGPGGDVAALRAVAPQGHVLAVDTHAPFIETLARRFAGDARVQGRVRDMLTAEGPFDLIWCAGAIYFTGVSDSLRRWRTALASGGAVAFSHPCLFRPATPEPVKTLCEGYPVSGIAGIGQEIEAAGFELLGDLRVTDAAWESCFGPLEHRIACLRAGADTALAEILDAAETEIALWRRYRDRFGYLLCVVTPI